MTNPEDAPLLGLRILIVEDRYLIASDLGAEVQQLGGGVVGPCKNLDAAGRLLASQTIDIALLDVNLDGTPVFPLARTLADRGTPFIFLTGYDDLSLSQEWGDRPRLRKPINVKDLRDELIKLRDAI